MQKRNTNKLLDPNNGNISPNKKANSQSPKSSKGDLRVLPGSNRNSGSFGELKEASSDGSKSPTAFYKKLQRSHSSTNNYEQV